MGEIEIFTNNSGGRSTDLRCTSWHSHERVRTELNWTAMGHFSPRVVLEAIKWKRRPPINFSNGKCLFPCHHFISTTPVRLFTVSPHWESPPICHSQNWWGSRSTWDIDIQKSNRIDTRWLCDIYKTLDLLLLRMFDCKTVDTELAEKRRRNRPEAKQPLSVCSHLLLVKIILFTSTTQASIESAAVENLIEMWRRRCPEHTIWWCWWCWCGDVVSFVGETLV